MMTEQLNSQYELYMQMYEELGLLDDMTKTHRITSMLGFLMQITLAMHETINGGNIIVRREANDNQYAKDVFILI